MIELEDARQRILSVLPAPVGETVPVNHAYGRFLSEPVCARVDLPRFDNSAFDGFAVRTADVSAACAERPVRLRRIGRVEAGGIFAGQVSSGACVRIFTGAALPAGADAIVMQEDTNPDATEQDCVWVCDAVKPWEGVRFRGEDTRLGEQLAPAGQRVGVGLQSLIAASGVNALRVGRPPIVSVIATGSELCEPGTPLAAGKIYESNRVALVSMVRLAGAEARVYPLVEDGLEATISALEAALAGSDVVVSSGGASVGEADYVKEAFRRLGGKIDFWKVAIKPGKPFIFGQCGAKFLFGLPGNPVSALVTFALLVRPALLRWQGASRLELPVQRGRLAEAFANRGDRRHFVRVVVGSDGSVRSAGLQASHALRTLAAADGLLDLRAGQILSTGAEVAVLRFEP
jgi:molybdopterin molybdotransferase